MALFTIFAIAIVWLLILTYFFYRTNKTFNSLRKGVEIDLSNKGFGEIEDRLKSLEAEGKSHVQKISLVRFNPFKELGGDHSFSLALLDGNNNGVIITSLHTRDRTRVYMKDVKSGKSQIELSANEDKALIEAIKK